MRIVFDVAGMPVPQGSTKAFVNRRTGKAIVTSTSGNKLKDWRDQIGYAARDAMRGQEMIEQGPVTVVAAFRLPRPKSRPKKDTMPDRKPDIDKLARALLDAMTHVVWRDDSQVCRMDVEKVYGPPGVAITVIGGVE